MFIFAVDRHFTHTDVNVLLHIFCANIDPVLFGRWLGTELYVTTFVVRVQSERKKVQTVV